MTRILYVTWDSPDVDYLETLFAPILGGLRAHGFTFDVLQFGWGTQHNGERARMACQHHGLGYRRVSVLRRFGPIGPMTSAFLGGRTIAREMRARGSDALLVRGVMPSLAALRLVRRKRIPLALDLDGLQLDERIDFAGRSPLAFQHRLLRDVEYNALHHARTIMVRTEAAARIATARAGAGFDPARIFVVENGRDAETFMPVADAERRRIRAELGFDLNAPLLVYAGSYGPQYRFDLMLNLFDAVRKLAPEAGLLILTAAPTEVKERIVADRPAYGDRCRVQRVAPATVPHYLAAGDVGLAFREPTFATQAVQPIKLGEYLLCGLIVVGTPGIGGMGGDIVDGAFIAMDDTLASISSAAAQIVATSSAHAAHIRARQAGLERFSIETTIASYAKALSVLAAPDSKGM